MVVNLFLYLLYFVSHSSVLFFRNCLYNNFFFFLHAFFNDFVIHSLSTRLFFPLTLLVTIGQFLLYKFATLPEKVLYVQFTSSLCIIVFQFIYFRSFTNAHTVSSLTTLLLL